ncbi:MAG: hypothetical protein O7C60_02295, partial [Rickettsia endosymbiont of Ixodes persulcatus]|nr:hypothetical protein [Rickettsia endosymbiont of Ixodes persulcatus]
SALDEVFKEVESIQKNGANIEIATQRSAVCLKMLFTILFTFFSFFFNLIISSNFLFLAKEDRFSPIFLDAFNFLKNFV